VVNTNFKNAFSGGAF